MEILMNTKELRRLMPQNAQDVEAARQLVLIEPSMLMPIIPDMLRHLKDHKSPVADIYCNFLALNGEPFVELVESFLAKSSMPDLKNVIVTRILVHWSHDTLVQLSGTMQWLVTNTDFFFNTDLVLIKLLHLHSIADPKWLCGWLEFKRNRLAILLEEANQVASFLDMSENAT